MGAMSCNVFPRETNLGKKTKTMPVWGLFKGFVEVTASEKAGTPEQ